MAARDPPLQGPHLAGLRLDEALLPPGQGGHHRVRQVERAPGPQPALLDTQPHRVGLAQRRRLLHRRVHRPVHGHHVVRPDELVEFDVVDVPRGAGLRRMQHDEHVVGVRVHLRHVVALDAVLHRERVEPEHVGEHPHRLGVARRHVHPDEPFACAYRMRSTGHYRSRSATRSGPPFAASGAGFVGDRSATSHTGHRVVITPGQLGRRAVTTVRSYASKISTISLPLFTGRPSPTRTPP
jgi:hypothetical protein